MFAAFVAFAIVGQAPTPWHVQDVWDQLTKLGYSSTRQSAQDDGYRRVKIEGFEVSVSLSRSTEGVASAARFTFNYQGARLVSPRYVQSWLGSRTEFGQLPVSASVGLDGRLTLLANVSLEGVGALERLKAGAANFGGALTSLQTEVPAAKTAMVFPLDENQTVDCLEWNDVSYLVDRWNWTYSGAFGFSSPVMLVPANIDGVMVVISNPHPGYLVRDHLMLYVTQKLPEGKDGEALVAGLKKKIAPVQAEIDGYGNLSVRQDIDLSGGIKLSKLKSLMKSFADKLKPYVKPT